jgi:hypothetical protein
MVRSIQSSDTPDQRVAALGPGLMRSARVESRSGDTGEVIDIDEMVSQLGP